MEKKFFIIWDFETLNNNRLKLIALQEKLREKGEIEECYNGFVKYSHKGFTWAFRDLDLSIGSEYQEGRWCLLTISKKGVKQND